MKCLFDESCCKGKQSFCYLQIFRIKNTLLTVTSCIKQLLLCSFLFLVVGVDGVVGGEVEAAALLALEGEAGDEITHVDHVAEFADVL